MPRTIKAALPKPITASLTCSIVQMKDDIDCRIVETVSDVYVGIVKLSKIVDTFDDMIDIMAETKPFPKFAGIITGPSRTADIECSVL